MINNLQYPEKSLYVIGAKIIDVFKSNIYASKNIISLHDDYESLHGNISYPYFIYALDWLFIIGLVNLNKKGELTLCS
ncbi:ABC-three component system middle component 6 [Pantoea sp. A4]|uniref:ABC-three component system middle component 6 n=1 Tax=Pantoea sp. A4 TaxID=1225184 RepID=UPI0003622B0C